jgi:hypothetical protein
MLSEANITVVTGLVGLVSAQKDGTTLKSVITESGVQLQGVCTARGGDLLP